MPPDNRFDEAETIAAALQAGLAETDQPLDETLQNTVEDNRQDTDDVAPDGEAGKLA